MCESQKMSTNSISISLPFPSNEWTQQPSMATNNPAKPSTTTGAMVQQQLHHNKQEALKCPRCDSSNTKFCYYNNYSLSQPRHFCKACKRYWTRGGTLRNVPVGGGSRKNKRHHHHHHKIIKSYPSPAPATSIPPVAAAPRASSSSSPLDPSTFFYPCPAGVLGAAAPRYPGIDSELVQFCANSSDLCFVKDVMGGDGGGGGASRVGNNAMNINQFDAPFASASYSSNPADIGDLAYSHFWNSMLSSLI